MNQPMSRFEKFDKIDSLMTVTIAPICLGGLIIITYLIIPRSQNGKGSRPEKNDKGFSGSPMDFY